jgi:hypothetical protein
LNNQKTDMLVRFRFGLVRFSIKKCLGLVSRCHRLPFPFLALRRHWPYSWWFAPLHTVRPPWLRTWGGATSPPQQARSNGSTDVVPAPSCGGQFPASICPTSEIEEEEAPFALFSLSSISAQWSRGRGGSTSGHRGRSSLIRRTVVVGACSNRR